MTAREIIRAEYGSAPNLMTPDVLRIVKVRHPLTGQEGAAEIAEGNGFAPRGDDRRHVFYGVSVVWVAADGSTCRDIGDETTDPTCSRTFFDSPTSDPWPTRGEGYAAAVEFVRGLGARI